MILTPNHILVPAAYMGIVGALRIFSGANPAFTRSGATCHSCSSNYSRFCVLITNRRSELAYQLKDTEARVLLAHPSLLQTAVDAAQDAGLSKERLFQFSELEQPLRQGISDWRSILSNERDAEQYQWGELSEEEATKTVAAINYSSGTTGLPKGVCVSHYNIIANVEQSRFMIDLRRPKTAEGSRRWIGFLPIYHAYGQLYICLIAPKLGVPVYVMQQFNFEEMLQTVQDHKITHLHVAPPIMVLLAKRPEVSKYDLSSLTNIGSGAAPLASELQKEVSRNLDVRVSQGWGMTELTCGTIITPHDIDAE